MKNDHKMNVCFLRFFLLLLLPAGAFSQRVTYSDPVKENSRSMNFEIIGKMKGNILIFKNERSNYAIDIYDNDMQIKESTPLIIPDNAYNIKFINGTDSIYLFYEYQKKSIVHCMAAKLNAEAKLISDPVELDNTKIDWLGDNKVYTMVYSDDKQRIIIFKVLRKSNMYNIETLLFDNNLKLIRQSQSQLPFDERYDVLSDFFVDNTGGFVFAKAVRAGYRDNIEHVNLVMKPADEDTFQIKNINLNNNYLDEIKLKVDNVNKHYIINAFYYSERSGNIEGLFCNTWDKQGDSTLISNFIPFDDTLRAVAKSNGSKKSSFNDFFIRNIIVKKDGGYILAAEDFSEQQNLGYNQWNRDAYLYGNPYALTPYYYNTSPFSWQYSPYNNLNNNQNTRYFYDNILLLNIDNTGKPQWGNIIHKDQYADENDDNLSYLLFNTGGEIHFLFNEIERKNMLLTENVVTPDGTLSRNPPLKTMEMDYGFMPKFGRQTGARQVVIPFTFRNSICFAKIDY